MKIKNETRIFLLLFVIAFLIIIILKIEIPNLSYEAAPVTSSKDQGIIFKVVGWGSSHFGGPNDKWVKVDETGSVTWENLRSLDVDNDIYVAYPMNYNLPPEAQVPGKENYKLKQYKMKITNPKTGQSTYARIIDRGPRPAKVIDMSLGAKKAIGLPLAKEEAVLRDKVDAELVLISEIQAENERIINAKMMDILKAYYYFFAPSTRSGT